MIEYELVIQSEETVLAATTEICRNRFDVNKYSDFLHLKWTKLKRKAYVWLMCC